MTEGARFREVNVAYCKGVTLAKHVLVSSILTVFWKWLLFYSAYTLGKEE